MPVIRLQVADTRSRIFRGCHTQVTFHVNSPIRALARGLLVFSPEGRQSF